MLYQLNASISKSLPIRIVGGLNAFEGFLFFVERDIADQLGLNNS